VFHEPDIAKLEMRVSREKLPTWQKTWEPTGHTLAGMAKMTGHTPAIRIRGAARQHLYIQEWMKHLGVSDERLAQRLGVTTPTVWKRRTQQHRLNPGKIAEIAHALGIKPTDLWRPPEPSEPPQGLDSRVRDVPQALREIAHAHANAAIDAVLKSAMAAKKTGT
jgi:transcriptional regulator with XRE-family HTH domain